MANLKSEDVKSELDKVVSELIRKATTDLEGVVRSVLQEHETKIEVLAELEGKTASDLITSALVAGVKDFVIRPADVQPFESDVRARILISPGPGDVEIFVYDRHDAPRVKLDAGRYRAILLLMKVG